MMVETCFFLFVAHDFVSEIYVCDKGSDGVSLNSEWCVMVVEMGSGKRVGSDDVFHGEVSCVMVVMESGGVSHEEMSEVGSDDVFHEEMSEVGNDDVFHEEVNHGWYVKVVEMVSGEWAGNDYVSYEVILL